MKVAAVFQVSLKAVDNWWARWPADGREALVARPRDLGPAGQLWTRAGVGDLIAMLYRVRLTEQGVGKCLRRWVDRQPAPRRRLVRTRPPSHPVGKPDDGGTHFAARLDALPGMGAQEPERPLASVKAELPEARRDVAPPQTESR